MSGVATVGAASTLSEPGPNFRDLQSLDERTQIRIDGLEKQVAAQKEDIDRFLAQAGWYSILVILVLGVLGVTTFTSAIFARKRAEEAVKDEARVAAEEWLDKNQETVLKHISEEIKKLTKEATDDIEERAGEAKQEQEAIALYNKGVLLRGANKFSEAIAAYDEVVGRFGKVDEPALREWVAKALVNKGFALGKDGKPEEAIAVYDEVVERFGEVDEPALREMVAWALNNKGSVMDEIGKLEEAFAAHNEVVTRFGDADEPDLRERVAHAYSGLADTRRNMAKKARLSPDMEGKAQALLEQSLKDADRALKIDPDFNHALSNKGYALFLLDRTEEAEPLLRQALALGDEEFCNDMLADAAIHPISEDAAFIKLINSLWDEIQAERAKTK